MNKNILFFYHYYANNIMADCVFDIGDLKPVTNIAISDGECTVTGFYTGVVNCNNMTTNNSNINNPILSSTTLRSQLMQQTQYASGNYALTKNAQPINFNTGSFTLKNPGSYDIGGGSFNYAAVAWSPQLGLFCAMRNDTSTPKSIYVSPNGANWTAATTETINPDISGQWRALCWSPQLGIFCAATETGGIGGKVIISSDGYNWTSYITGYDRYWKAMCWAPQLGIFCAVGSGNGSSIKSASMISSDGINWKSAETPGDSYLFGVCWSPELAIFAAIGIQATDRIMTSKDGLNWTIIKYGQNHGWRDVCWSPQLGLFCAIANGGTTTERVMISSDGINWRLISSPGANSVTFNTIDWCPEIGVFVASGLSVCTSRDGVNWTNQYTYTGQVSNSAWAPELGILCGVSLSVPRIARTSSIYRKIPTQMNVFDFSYNNINQNGTWTIQQILRTITTTTAVNPLAVTGQQYMRIENTSALTISEFTGGMIGQRLTLSFINANITISSSANIKINGAFTSTANDTISFVCIQTSPSLWLETRRSINTN